MRWSIFTFLALIGAVVILLVYAITLIRSEGAICLENPTVYGVQKLGEANGADVTCTCTANRPNSATVLITKDGITPLETNIKQDLDYEEFNLSGIEFVN